MGKQESALLLIAAAVVFGTGYKPAFAGVISERCLSLLHEKAERAKHFGMLLVPFKNDVLNTMSAGGNTAAVKCSYIRRIEIDQAVIYRITRIETRDCPGGQFLDPEGDARMLAKTREAKAKYCGSR